MAVSHEPESLSVTGDAAVTVRVSGCRSGPGRIRRNPGPGRPASKLPEQAAAAAPRAPAGPWPGQWPGCGTH